ncbi:MAG: cellulase family glycosylhydrolase, partial [Rhodospirillales bacterium]|nr:cellulase family glycosylhydrolase [Acetobacter sp.]
MTRLSLAALAALALAASASAQQVPEQPDPAAPTAEMFPFVLPWDDNAPSIVDLSSWLDTPAGKHGFVTAKDGHFYVGDKRIRFLGVNTAFDTNFPSHEDAEKVAAHMAKYGIGCVRLHHMDTRSDGTGLMKSDNATIDPDRLDRLDYFVAALKDHGIYVNINLHVGRAYPGFEKTDAMSNYFKGVDNFMAGMIESQKQFARDLLQHVNPYTKLAYTDDPCVAFVEINNENALFLEWHNKKIDQWLPPYSDELRRQWNAWLTSKYSTDEKLQAAWKGDPLADTAKLGAVEINKKVDDDKRSHEEHRDWIAFLYSVEEKYWGGMYRFLKDDLHVRSVVVGTPQVWSPLPVQLGMDAVDCHGYWQHPSFPHKPWDGEDWTVKNLPMVSEPNGGLIGSLGRLHAAGKPFICTEYMECAPNTYNAETMGLLGAYAALQDWDAVFLFAYAHWTEEMKAGYYKSFFDVSTHPAKLATFPAAAAMFVRGDVATAEPQIVSLPRGQIVELTRQHGP